MHTRDNVSWRRRRQALCPSLPRFVELTLTPDILLSSCSPHSHQSDSSDSDSESHLPVELLALSLSSSSDYPWWKKLIEPVKDSRVVSEGWSSCWRLPKGSNRGLWEGGEKALGYRQEGETDGRRHAEESE